MLTRHTVDRIRGLDGNGYPVLSLYLGLKPGVGTLREVPTRLKDMLSSARDEADRLPREQAMSLREDLSVVQSMIDRIGSDLGRGVAIFRCARGGVDEYLSLPAPVRDRAIVDATAYVRPLDAMLDHYHRFCAVVVGRRRANIFRFYMGNLESWEEMAEEEIRKSNFGGFSGYEERRVRSRAEEVAQRFYREIAQRLYQLLREPGFDLLLVGGSNGHVEGLRAVLHADLRASLAGTFTIDPGTMTPATVQEQCARLADDYDRQHQLDVVDRLLDASRSGGAAAVGVEEVLPAINQRAVDLLVIQGSQTIPGYVCPACGWITASAQRCVACGGPTRPVPDVLDAMAEAVRAAGGDVQHVLTETALTSEVGALLRYPVRAAS